MSLWCLAQLRPYTPLGPALGGVQLRKFQSFYVFFFCVSRCF
jgi:hypothetical protein